MMEMMETLSMLELDREMDWIESKVIEMMEEDIEDGQDIQDELEDEDGDQVMPEVDTLTSKEMMDTSDMYTRPEETEMQVVEDNHTITSGSVVGVESFKDYPHHYGGAHTPLLGPTTIPEKGVELGLVIGLQPTGEKYVDMTEDMTDSLTVAADVMHTPTLGPSLGTDMERDMMRVLHTPLLRPTCILNTITSNICNNSGAGIVTNNKGNIDIDVLSERYKPDMRKHATNNGSPKFSSHIDMDKTPTVLGGRVEHFGRISDMILHWEGMEEEEERKEMCMKEGGGRKRLSQRINELSGRFEEGRDSTNSSQTGTVCREGEEGLEISFTINQNLKLPKLSAGTEEKYTNKLVGNTRPTFLISSNPDYNQTVSTNQSSEAVLREELTNQTVGRGVKRKGNWTEDQGGLLMRERRVVSKVFH
jgi:hypothetical protein